jgi:uncharacterized protein
VLIAGWAFVAVAAAVCLGAVLQGVLGFGMVIVAFPVLVTVEPELLPQSMLVVSVFTTMLIAWQSRGETNWFEVGWFTAGRPLGLVGAVAILAVLDRSTLTLAGGTVVLAAIGLSVWAPEVRRTPKALFWGGSVSSLFGTAIAIGGPPMGLLYQRSDGATLRSTVSVLSLTSAPIGIAILLITGNFEVVDLRTGLALAPFGLIGAACSRFVIPYFDLRLRPIILGVCAVAALGAMARVVL